MITGNKGKNKEKLDQRLERAELVTRQEIIRARKEKRQRSVLINGGGKSAGI